MQFRGFAHVYTLPAGKTNEQPISWNNRPSLNKPSYHPTSAMASINQFILGGGIDKRNPFQRKRIADICEVIVLVRFC